MNYFSIEGVYADDDDYRKKAAAYAACVEAGIGIPDELCSFFNHQPPQDLEVKTADLDAAGREEDSDDSYIVLVDLSKVPEGVTHLRISCSA